jgi:hypothetical protein
MDKFVWGGVGPSFWSWKERLGDCDTDTRHFHAQGSKPRQKKKKTRGPAKLVVLFGGVDRARGSCSFPFPLWADCLLAEASFLGRLAEHSRRTVALFDTAAAC